MLRTHTCGDLRESNVKKETTICGWVDTRRDHGGIIFIDLRDRYGITQVVFEPSHNKDIHKLAEGLRREFVIQVKGSVRKRGKDLENPNLKTGKIEVLADEMTIFSKSETPPIEIDDRKVANEDMRLKYRYLDLRRPSMQNALEFRHKVINLARDFFNKNNFLEIETPLLIKSTPEGARDYVVPSRVNPGRFYALPQSPQLYKQILMISGCDRYYQIARCLRDEDLRTDRQPEHTQFDLEMSFVEQEDIRDFVEGLYKYIFKEAMGIKLADFPVFSYREAMERFGKDKPDIRFGLELVDVSDIVKKCDFGVFTSVVKSGGVVKCLNPQANMSRKDIDRYISYAQELGARGMAWMRVTKEGLESNIAKYFSEDVQKELIKRTGSKPGSVLMFFADNEKAAANLAGEMRLRLGEDLDLIEKDDFKFAWVNDFPLFSFNEETNSWEPEHHMFSMPNQEFVKNFEKCPGNVTGDLWDLVLNGIELGSGSIRVSDPKIQSRIMNFVGIKEKEAEEKFGFLLNAYKYGGPPHGGMGLGADRLVALMLGTNDIREVIAFPKNKAAQCPMDESPGTIDSTQLKELHLKLDIVAKKESAVLDRIKALLEKDKVKYEVVEHEAVYTSDQAAKARGTELKQGAKALIFKADTKFVQCVVSAAKEINMEKLNKILNASKLRLATPDEVKRETGCSVGSVPPFGNLFNLPVYLDKTVIDNEIVAFNAGSHTNSIKMKSKDLVKLTKAKIENFS